MHFLKVMKLASSRDDARRIYESLHDLVHMPITDSLNVKNGFNYSMFLESIIRIAYHKLDEHGPGSDDGGFKGVLEQMFNDGNIELKRRMMDDRMLSELYSHDNGKVFYEHSTLLSAVFSAKAQLQLENFLEMSKEDFMGILVESGILNDKREEPESITGEIKRKFNGENIFSAIHNVGTFDSMYLTYIDFLDCLVRVAQMYPFGEADRGHFASMDQKLQYLIALLGEKYGAIVGPYIDIMGKRENDMRYQPRQVTDDDADDDYDD
jgi:hypothetical protein